LTGAVGRCLPYPRRSCLTFLRRFDPSAIDPLYLVDRQDDLDWLAGAVSDYLRDPDPKAHGHLSFCILGEKGVGKTIFTRAGLRQARVQFSDRAIFVEADCRRFRTAKSVIDAIAKDVVAALGSMPSSTGEGT
jgi:Cdc6-like AAA superfamily ATPase